MGTLYKDWKELLKAINRIPSHEDPVIFNCICENCGEEIPLINRAKNKTLKWIKSKHEILCEECGKEEIRKENSKNGIQCRNNPEYREKMKNNGFFKLYDFGNFVFTMRT